MPVNVISTIKPKNGGSFPVVEAVDVKINDEQRLDVALAAKASQADVTELQTAVAGKASQTELDTLSLTVAGKASAADLATTNAALAGKADASNVTLATANLQAQIDAIVTPVTQDAEVENARVGADSTTYASLKARLDSESTASAKDAKWDRDRVHDINSAIYSRNLFNKDEFIPDSERDGTTGEIKPNANHYGVSPIIPIESGKTLYFSNNGTAQAPTYIYVYDKNKAFINRSSGTTTYLIPNNVGYISVCIYRDNVSKYQIEYDEVTTFVDFEIILNNAKFTAMQSEITAATDTVNSVKSDIVDITDVLYSKNIFDASTFVPDAERSGTTGEIIANAQHYGTSLLMPVISGETLYFSKNGVAQAPTYIYTYQDDQTFISRSAGATTFAVPNNCGYIAICIPNDQLSKYQIQYKQVTPYEDHDYNLKEISDKNYYYYQHGNSENPLEVIKETPGFMSVFHTVGCIGDSLASGLVSAYKTNDETKYYPQFYNHSWGQCLARVTGNTYYNFSTGGLDTRTWLASNYATQCYDGEHNCTAYVIGLGQNDNNHDIPIGTIDDIKEDYTQNADTFYGNYGKIIQRIKAMFPLTKPKIFVCTDPLKAVEDAGYNEAIRAIASYFNNVWLLDLYQYGQQIIKNPMMVAWRRDAHYNAMGYQYCSWIIASYIDWIIRNNPSSFCDVELIGTQYYYHTGENQ